MGQDLTQESRYVRRMPEPRRLAERLDAAIRALRRCSSIEAEEILCHLLAEVRGEDGRPPCPGPGWEWDAFAKAWYQPGAKGPAIGRVF